MTPCPPLYRPPPGYGRVRIVGSFQELVTTPFRGGVNALCWPRRLAGDFAEVVRPLAVTDDITPVDESMLRALPLSPEGRTAVATLVEDLERLRAHGLAPILDCIRGYPRDEKAGTVRTDVYSYHADSATVETDTYLCSYTEMASEGLRNEALDTMMQAEAAAIKFGVRDLTPAVWDRFEAERARPIEGAQLDFEEAPAALSLAQAPAPVAPPALAPAIVRPAPERVSSFVGGRRKGWL